MKPYSLGSCKESAQDRINTDVRKNSSINQIKSLKTDFQAGLVPQISPSFTENPIVPTVYSKIAVNIMNKPELDKTLNMNKIRNMQNVTKQLSKESSSKNEAGMVKIKEKVTSNGGTFCTFRNVTRNGTPNNKSKNSKKRGMANCM